MKEEENIRRGVGLAPYTTMGLGGPADYFVECDSVESVGRALRWAGSEGVGVQVLGGGSNTVFADAGFDGLVLKVGIGGVRFVDGGDWVEVRVGAGEDWDGLVRACVNRGLGGIECLAGIPGLVGATPIQNVGAYGQEVKQTIARVVALDRRTLEAVEFEAGECDFGYRHSRFKGADKDRYLIVEVYYRLRKGGRPQLRYAELQRQVEAQVELAALADGAQALGAVREVVLQLRRKKSMVIDADDPNSRSAGSFFLNPVLSAAALQALESRLGSRRQSLPVYEAEGGFKVPAAWLVEQAGFHKGYRSGGAGVSQNHTLALVNCDGTTAELMALAGAIQDRVEALFGVRLNPEPVLLP